MFLSTCGSLISSFPGHFTALHKEFGDPDAGFLPQNRQSHTKKRFQAVLGALFECQKGAKSDGKFHGKMSGATKKSLAERLAARLGEVVEEGRCAPALSEGDEEDSSQSPCGVADDAEHGA